MAERMMTSNRGITHSNLSESGGQDKNGAIHRRCFYHNTRKKRRTAALTQHLPRKKEDSGSYARCLPEGRKCAIGASLLFRTL